MGGENGPHGEDVPICHEDVHHERTEVDGAGGEGERGSIVGKRVEGGEAGRRRARGKECESLRRIERLEDIVLSKTWYSDVMRKT